MKVEVYKLLKEGPLLLHIGLRRLDRTSNIIHSDTLFSALSNSLTKLFGEEKFDLFEKNLVISSVFPGLRLSKDILLLPKPEIPIKTSEEDHKKYKKLQWISLDALKKLLENFDKNLKQISLQNVEEFKFLNPRTLITKSEFEEIGEEIYFMSTILEPKVRVSRETYYKANADEEKSYTTLYFQENLELHPIKLSNGKIITPFLYFLKMKNDEIEELFTPSLNLTIEEGLGGERTTGKGIFDTFEKEELEVPENGEFEISLSLTFPKREEVDNLIYYQLVKRDGFIYYQKPTGYRKKTHYKIAEGALVRSPYVGENVDVSPISSMKVISYGKSLGFKIS